MPVHAYQCFHMLNGLTVITIVNYCLEVTGSNAQGFIFYKYEYRFTLFIFYASMKYPKVVRTLFKVRSCRPGYLEIYRVFQVIYKLAVFLP